jgi:hypothetical protein
MKLHKLLKKALIFEVYLTDYYKLSEMLASKAKNINCQLGIMIQQPNLRV